MNQPVSPDDPKPRKVLMLAYVFPPFFSVGGSMRIVKFIKYLPASGWLPVVLTIDDKTEYSTQRREGSEALLADIPKSVKIYRTSPGEPSVEFLEKSRKAKRKNVFSAVALGGLSWLRRLARRLLLIPDENITWLPFALRTGRQIVDLEAIDVIFATCPPFSVAIIGSFLKYFTRRPLILDFRDDWVDTRWFNLKPWWVRQTNRLLEHWVVRYADKVILVTEWSRRAFVARYPKESEAKFAFISNGCDLEDYAGLRNATMEPQTAGFTIVHSGLLGTSQGWKRNPRPFFQALSILMKQNRDLASRLSVMFTGHLPEEFSSQLEDLGLSTVVTELGFVPRDEYARLLNAADILLAINYEDYPTLIPGKIYEYWAVSGPPILLLSVKGAAQSLVETHELGICVPPSDVDAIKDAILDTYQKRVGGTPRRIKPDGIEQYDRRFLAAKLAMNLSKLAHAEGECRA